MATTVHEGEELTLMDGSVIKVRPLKISLLRPFMKKFEQVAAVAEDNEKSMTLLIECVQIAMEQYKPELAKDLKALEEIMDLPTVYKVIEAASGVKLTDANSLLNTVLANN
jgi:DNA-binding protein H-NS